MWAWTLLQWSVLSSPSKTSLTEDARAHVMGRLQPGMLQNQDAAWCGGSPSTKYKAKLHIMGHAREGLESGPPTMFSLPCQHLGTTGSLLQSCSQSLQDNMANGSLPRELGEDCIQPISGLIGLPGGPDCSSQSGLFVLVSATNALEPEHVEEDRENAMLTSSVKNPETGFCVFYQSISILSFLWIRVRRQTCSHQFSCSHHQKPCCHFGSMLIIILMTGNHGVSLYLYSVSTATHWSILI